MNWIEPVVNQIRGQLNGNESSEEIARLLLVAGIPAELQAPLLEQLAPGGRLVAPVGERHQELVVIRRTPRGFRRESVIPVRFVPMTGEAQTARDEARRDR